MPGRVPSPCFFPYSPPYWFVSVFLPFPFQGSKLAALADANPRASGGPVQRWLLGILIACSLRSSRNKIPAMPLRALDIPASGDAQGGLHRLRSCSPSTKGKTP